MRKAIIFILSVVLAVSVVSMGCSSKMEQWETKTYITDLERNVVAEVLTSYDIPRQVRWSENSRHFAVTENVLNSKGETINQIARVYIYGAGNKVEMLKEINDRGYSIVSVKWADKENLVVYQSGKAGIRYSHYNALKNSIETITMRLYNESASGRDAIFAYRYQAPRKDEIRRELVKKTGMEYEEGILTLDGTRFIFCAKDNSVRLLDVNTGKTTQLFYGVGLVLSPGETKVAYTVPKSKNITEFNRYGTFESTDMETWVYDLKKRTSVKVADFYAAVFFSPDDRYTIFYPEDYIGQPSA